MLKIQIILLRGKFNNFRPENGWKFHKTHNRPLPWQQMSKRLNLFILFICTHRPFTSQVISKIYFLTFASYIEKLSETTIKYKGLWKILKKQDFKRKSDIYFHVYFVFWFSLNYMCYIKNPCRLVCISLNAFFMLNLIMTLKIGIWNFVVNIFKILTMVTAIIKMLLMLYYMITYCVKYMIPTSELTIIYKRWQN